nr:hypothetical protein [Tanacetum cinerariifolium]
MSARTRTSKKGKCSFMSIYPKTTESSYLLGLEHCHPNIQ